MARSSSTSADLSDSRPGDQPLVEAAIAGSVDYSGAVETTTAEGGKLPPQNLAAEMSLLGALLIDDETLVDIADQVKADDFYDRRHQAIFKAIMKRYQGGGRIDLLTVSSELSKAHQLDQAGGRSYLSDLTNTIPSASHAVDYARIVREASVRRKLTKAGEAISDLASKSADDIQEILSQAEASLYAVSSGSQHSDMVSLESLLSDAFEKMSYLHQNKGELRGIRTGNLTQEDFSKISDTMGEMSEIPIKFEDKPGMTMLEMKVKAQREAHKSPLGLIIVDYLQLMSGSRQYGDNRVQEISEISRGLKLMARELDVPVLALSQLSRSVEQRPDKRPMLSDLRESGSIEQDADIVMFVYREDYYNPDTERQHITDLIIGKHRNGPVGTVELYFHPEKLKFMSLEKRKHDK